MSEETHVTTNALPKEPHITENSPPKADTPICSLSKVGEAKPSLLRHFQHESTKEMEF